MDCLDNSEEDEKTEKRQKSEERNDGSKKKKKNSGEAVEEGSDFMDGFFDLFGPVRWRDNIEAAEAAHRNLREDIDIPDSILAGYTDPQEGVRDYIKYHEQIKASDGFDVGYFPKIRAFSMIRPALTSPRTIELSKDAIVIYNGGHVVKYNPESVRVRKATGVGCAGIQYRITFEAKKFGAKEDDAADTFRTCAYWPWDGVKKEVLFCDLEAICKASKVGLRCQGCRRDNARGMSG